MWYLFVYVMLGGKMCWMNTGHHVMSRTKPVSPDPDEKYVYWKDC